jgi:hypothetical protein
METLAKLSILTADFWTSAASNVDFVACDSALSNRPTRLSMFSTHSAAGGYAVST